ncbi:MAG: NUDIX domain-containing protein [Desulfobulbaceae bacterium]|nr:NUDIX domain-containing protein [Desulfobulbaceae bacterium]
MDSSREIITVVDEKNNETGQVPRAEMRARNLIHRATYILVYNSKGQLFVQKRTESKDIYPGYYEIAAGGVVLAGESYELSAKRELKEELGIDKEELTFLFDHYHDDGSNRVWGRIFSCIHDGPMHLQAEEVESGEFMEVGSILSMAQEHPFCPDGLDILRKIIANKQ